MCLDIYYLYVYKLHTLHSNCMLWVKTNIVCALYVFRKLRIE